MKVLVTGSTRGLGYEIAKSFEREFDCDVVYNGRGNMPDGICDPENYLKLESRYLSVNELKVLGVDVVVNNAFDLNKCDKSLLGQVWVLQNSVDYFKLKSIRGVVININSIAAINGEPTYYAAAKRTLRGLSLSIKKDANEHGITIIDVYPGAIKTEWTKDRPDWNDLIDPQELASFIVDLVKPSSFYVDEVIVRRPKC